MKIHPFIKLLIFSIAISVLSCVTAPKVTDIAELRYGDEETEIVEKIGRGYSVLYYDINNINYHFRSYLTKHTHNDYSLLFANGKLVAVLQEPPSLEKCMTLDQQADWRECLHNFTSQMLDDSVKIGFHDFSGKIKEQKKVQAENTGNAAVVAAVAVPSLVVTWPFAVMCGGIMATGAMIDESDSTYEDCLGFMHEVTEQSDLLISSFSGQSVITGIETIHPKFVISTLDEHLKGRRIIGKRWGCGRKGASDDALDVKITVGLIDTHIIWAKLESKW